MSEPGPKVFGVPAGADFGAALVAGLRQRYPDPMALARVRVIVNTQRMRRRVIAALSDRPGLLPRIDLITDLGPRPDTGPLHRMLTMTRLVETLLDRDPALAPRAAGFGLAESLTRLLDEMESEGVKASDIEALDVGESHSEHWRRARLFLSIASDFGLQQPGPEALRRASVVSLTKDWARAAPTGPVIVAGSTGSRGTTSLLMQAVARLPRGAVILPGFDFDMDPDTWAGLAGEETGEDHPQFRFRAFLDAVDMAPGEVCQWGDAVPPVPARNRFVSLALRPAPVTDRWLTDGPGLLPDLAKAMQDVTLLEAPGPREEARAIAVALRAAAQDGIPAALITPDRMLTRRVSAALARWGIEPDDSAGRPLSLSAPGRFLRQTAEALAEALSAEALLALLKHPLCHSGSDRGEHLRHTRDLELQLLRGGGPWPSVQEIRVWAAARDAAPWGDWLAQVLADRTRPGKDELTAWMAAHRDLANHLAAGSGSGEDTELWAHAAGTVAAEAWADLEEAAMAAGPMTAPAYQQLLTHVLQGREVRDPVRPHPGVMIWGTLEARVQSADLVILAGLNEGTWPKLPDADPWLSRPLRRAAGLLSPERQIGLSAHDFQLGLAAGRVIVSRAIRDAEAPTVPARWLTRITNLLDGLGPDGRQVLSAMRARGEEWLTLAAELDRPEAAIAPAPRPAPQPPLSARPAALAVTDVKRLIRDPYALYAKSVLRLRPLDPLRRGPDALLSGTVLHRILERAVDAPWNGETAAREWLETVAEEEIAVHIPWPAAAEMLRVRIARWTPWFLTGEARRRAAGTPVGLERRLTAEVGPTGIRLIGTADRVDRLSDGRLVIYDYKSGSVPTARQIREFDKQLPMEGAVAERGGLKDLDPAPVAGLSYLRLSGDGEEVPVDLSNNLIEETWDGLVALLTAYGRDGAAYPSRTRLFQRSDRGDYDHLARYGEWDETTQPTPIKVGACD